MTISIIITESTALTKTKNPALPSAPVEYDRAYHDAKNNILRQYFNQIDNLIGQLSLTASSYGSFADTGPQTVIAADTGTVMTFDTTDFASGVSIVTSGGKASRVTVASPGIYNFQWSGQFQNTDSQDHDASIWVRKNGVDVIGSTGYVSVPSKHGAINGHTIAGWNFLFSLNAGDYIELWWETDSTAVSIQSYPAVTTPPAAVKPSTSSLVATMTFVSAI